MTENKIILKSECGRVFCIDLHEILDHHSKYYAKRNTETTYEEEYDAFQEDYFEVLDWMFNNMDWYECHTLKEISTKPKPLKDLQIEDRKFLTKEEFISKYETAKQ